MAELDFPGGATLGQRYTGPTGVVYEWNGYAWVVGFYDTSSDTLGSVGDLLSQVRTLLQDTDNSSGQYRYSSDSIVTNLNQGMLEMYRLRPDIFLSLGFVVPTFSSAALDVALGIEPQYVPPLIYYVVGLTQVRDDEGTQDTRASAFLQRFTAQLMTVTA
ncbi:MAG TPA: hypothetical protein VGF65_06045 [Mycobacterium sp.]|jgi:hypothetical protein